MAPRTRKASRGAQLALPISDSGLSQERPNGPARSLSAVGLFSGIGGIELGLEKAGHSTSLLCEIDSAASAVLRKRFPKIPLHDDVRTLDEIPRGTDLLAGGFPCQDLSQAGKTAGIAGSNSGLVRQVFRLLERFRTPWVLIENVPFMLHLGRGRALDVIIAELERLGYQWAYRVVDTRAFGLPQRRERVYLVASLIEDPRTVLFADDAGAPTDLDPRIINGEACGFYWTEGIRGLGWASNAIPTLKGGSTVGVPSPPAILFPSGLIATPDIRDAERLQGFPTDWTKPAETVAKKGFRWKLVGNAVSVPVARWLGTRLAQPGTFCLREVRKLATSSGAWPRAAWNVGDGRHAAEVSAWPFKRKAKGLEEFLSEIPHALSARATSGFLKRVDRSALRFPKGFREALSAHLAAVEALDEQ